VCVCVKLNLVTLTVLPVNVQSTNCARLSLVTRSRLIIIAVFHSVSVTLMLIWGCGLYVFDLVAGVRVRVYSRYIPIFQGYDI